MIQAGMNIVLLVGLFQLALGVTVEKTWVAHDPQVYPYNHMSTVARVGNNNILVAWQASHVGEGRPDQSIMLSRSTDD
eukprot:gene15847-4786_t